MRVGSKFHDWFPDKKRWTQRDTDVQRRRPCYCVEAEIRMM